MEIAPGGAAIQPPKRQKSAQVHSEIHTFSAAELRGCRSRAMYLHGDPFELRKLSDLARCRKANFDGRDVCRNSCSALSSSCAPPFVLMSGKAKRRRVSKGAGAAVVRDGPSAFGLSPSSPRTVLHISLLSGATSIRRGYQNSKWGRHCCQPHARLYRFRTYWAIAVPGDILDGSARVMLDASGLIDIGWEASFDHVVTHNPVAR